MDLSIVIPNFNTPQLVLDCIGSILKSQPTLSYEIIIVDNGSTDNSATLLKKINNRKVSVIINKANEGFSKACNKGILKSSGEYVLLLNSDTIVTKDALDALVDFARKNVDAGVVGSQLLNKDRTIQPSCFHFSTLTLTIQQYWLGKKGLLDKYAPAGEAPSEVDAIVGASFLITPVARKEVGLLDSRYFMFFEDLDYCRRVKKKGLKVYYLPQSKVIHLHGESGKKLADNDNQWRRLIASSKIYFGEVGHATRTFVMWSAQKFNKYFK